jgi:type II secretory pathway predicted ATPase ExeA/ribosomal protein L40E
MDIGLIILGVLILFGSTILLKAADFGGKSPADTASAEREAGAGASITTIPQGRKTKKIEEAEELPKVKICKNCMTENKTDAEFCTKCGKNLSEERDPEAFRKRREWFRRQGWIKNPFTLTVIPALFTGLKKEVDEVMKTLSMQSGHVLILGEAGSGKTTTLKWLELNLPSDYNPIYIFRPPERFDEIIDLIVGYSGDSDRRKYTMYNLDKVIQRMNKKFIILLDEAHEFKPELSQPLKTLGDIEGVTLVMAALPEAEDYFKNNARPLYNRIVSKIKLRPLTKGEMEEMVMKRIQNCGGTGIRPFTQKALERMYDITMGHPRKVLKVCDHLVKDAIEKNVDKIDADDFTKSLVTAIE